MVHPTSRVYATQLRHANQGHSSIESSAIWIAAGWLHVTSCRRSGPVCPRTCALVISTMSKPTSLPELCTIPTPDAGPWVALRRGAALLCNPPSGIGDPTAWNFVVYNVCGSKSPKSPYHLQFCFTMGNDHPPSNSSCTSTQHYLAR
jgi:hypothetical protein